MDAVMISSLATNLSVHIATFTVPLAKAAQEANNLSDNQVLAITTSALALIIKDLLDYPHMTPEAKAQLEKIIVEIITNYGGAEYND